MTESRTILIHTAAGTELILELGDEVSTLTRKPGMTKPEAGHAEPARLRGDFTPLPLLQPVDLGSIREGETAEFNLLVEDVPEERTTSVVTSVVEI